MHYDGGIVASVGPTCSEVDGIAQFGLRPWIIGRSLALGGLLAAELLALSIRFDRLTEASPWQQVFGQMAWTGAAGHLLIAVITAVLLLRGHELRASMRRITHAANSAAFSWLSLVVHLAAMSAFFRLTAIVIEGELPAARQPGLWIAGWFFAGTLSLIAWLLAFVPKASWAAYGWAPQRWLIPGFAVAAGAVAAGRWTDQFWGPLAKATFAIVERLLGFIGAEVISRPHEMVVGTPSFSVEIAPMCSGYEGVGLVLVFLAVFLWAYRQELRFPQSFLLLPIGVITIWLANAVRIAALIVVGTYISPSIAQGGFHSQAGWLAFNAVTLGLIAVAWNSAFFARAARQATSARVLPAAPYLVPFLVLLATAMVTGAFFGGGIDLLYPLRVFAVAAALIYFIAVYRREQILQWQWSWPAVAIGAAVFLIWMLLEPLAGVRDSVQTEQAKALSGLSATMAAIWIAFRIVGYVVITPLAEELAFRGYLTRRLISEEFDSVPLGRFTLFSLLASSAAFGLLHQSRWLAGGLAGLLFAAALYRRGRLMDAVLAHATANGLIAGYALATGNWTVWS
jgi:exosortase E/protease (VPEID-CTERM system)